jgi:hypothetical protein
MRFRTLLLPLLLLLAAADAPKTDVPKLEVFSRFGAGADAKLYNDETAVFYARRKGDPDTLLRGVRFVLVEKGGSPDRSECVLAETEDPKQWGAPPSTFLFPLETRKLPVGLYRLAARKRGWEGAEIGVVLARFGYFDLKVDHTSDHYVAAFRLRLADRSIPKRTVRVIARIRAAGGTVIASRKLTLASGQREHVFESPGRIRLSSRRKSVADDGTLPVTPGCSLVLEVDGASFRYPVPLPMENRRGRVGAIENQPTDRAGGRKGRGGGR